MAFCINCGHQLVDGAKFCANCGASIERNISSGENERKTVFDGEIHKCPKCGWELKAFDTVCPNPQCGIEIRGKKVSSAVQEFALKLESVASIEKRIELIKNFPVPNNKEDIFEFMLLAASNFDAEHYVSNLDKDDVSDAWLAKIELCYQKAKFMLLKNEIESVEKLYLEIKSKISKTQIKNKNKSIISIVFIVVGLLCVLTQILPIGAVGLVLLTVGIVRLVINNKKNIANTGKKDILDTKTGFSSWSITSKILWVILNIYTIGIPAIIYICCKKS